MTTPAHMITPVTPNGNPIYTTRQKALHYEVTTVTIWSKGRYTLW